MMQFLQIVPESIQTAGLISGGILTAAGSGIVSFIIVKQKQKQQQKEIEELKASLAQMSTEMRAAEKENGVAISKVFQLISPLSANLEVMGSDMRAIKEALFQYGAKHIQGG